MQVFYLFIYNHVLIMSDLLNKSVSEMTDEELNTFLNDNKLQQQADALVSKKQAAESEAYKRAKKEVDTSIQNYQTVEELLRKNPGSSVKISIEIKPEGKKKQKCTLEVGDEGMGSNRDMRNKRDNLVRTFGLLATDINRLDNQQLQKKYADAIARDRVK